jgi:AbiV family abortive infection protein
MMRKKKDFMQITSNKYLESAKLCLENAERLLDEVYWIDHLNPPSTQYFISIVAQEECAKSYLLYLVSSKIVPWHPLILRAARDHKCKQLLCIVLDYLYPDLEEFLQRTSLAVIEKRKPGFPAKVADAINLFRHEKIGRWESKTWFWAEDFDYDKTALKVYEGKIDIEKQQSLYVELSKDGEVCSTPWKVTKEQAAAEYERARRFNSSLQCLKLGKQLIGIDYEAVENAFKSLFSNFSKNDLNNLSKGMSNKYA